MLHASNVAYFQCSQASPQRACRATWQGIRAIFQLNLRQTGQPATLLSNEVLAIRADDCIPSNPGKSTHARSSLLCRAWPYGWRVSYEGTELFELKFGTQRSSDLESACWIFCPILSKHGSQEVCILTQFPHGFSVWPWGGCLLRARLWKDACGFHRKL